MQGKEKGRKENDVKRWKVKEKYEHMERKEKNAREGKDLSP